MMASRLNRRALRTVESALAAFTLAACANFGTSNLTPQGFSAHASPVGRSAAAAFTFYTVDYPNEHPNRITGIAKNREIVGVYGNNGSQGPYHSYTSLYNASQPYTQFQVDDFPNSQSTYMTSIAIPAHSTTAIQAGYVITPADLQGNWGVINNKGLWSLVRRNRGERTCHMMELFGIDAKYDAVGFYWNDDSPSGTCGKYTQYPTEVVPGEGFHDYPHVLGAYPSATGINRAGLLVGSTDVSGNGASKGWTRGQADSYKYWNYDNKSRLSTLMNGMNDAGVIVGTYKDLTGDWHGFIVSNLFSTTKQPVWQSIDEPDGDQESTVISGIDGSGDICGWYTGTDGLIHGFVGIRQ
ncbi:MAG TPA: hypothetical protein VFE16_05315 [Candidatus Cybelea sp.]|jgi:hypothetical protein|nr:hypothetical protein [Candidatus Cybelea sp.]